MHMQTISTDFSVHWQLDTDLAQTLLTRPHGGVDDLQEQLPGSRVEDENSSIDGFSGQVAFKCLGGVNRHG